jgi:hypothetical protein
MVNIFYNFCAEQVCKTWITITGQAFIVKMTSTVVPPSLLIQYLQFQLSAVYVGPLKNRKIKEINGS